MLYGMLSIFHIVHVGGLSKESVELVATRGCPSVLTRSPKYFIRRYFFIVGLTH